MGKTPIYILMLEKYYKIESIEEGQIINDILEQSINSIRIKEKKRKESLEEFNKQVANDFKYHCKRCIVIIIKKMLPKKVYKKLKELIKRG